MKREFPKDIEIPAYVKTSDIIKKTSKCFEVSYGDVLSKNRKKNIADARHAAITLLSHKGMSNIEIAEVFDLGTTVSKDARRATRDKYETDPFFATRFNMVVAMLKGESLELDIEKARLLVEKTDYWTAVANGTGSEIAKVDAVAFFMEGYNHALNKLKLV